MLKSLLLIGVNHSSMKSTLLTRMNNAKKMTNLSFPLFGLDLTTSALIKVIKLGVLAKGTNGIKFVNAANRRETLKNINPLNIIIVLAKPPELSTSRAFPWFSLISSKERDFVVPPFHSMIAKVLDHSTQTNPAERATRTAA